jgi:transposase-like protein
MKRKRSSEEFKARVAAEAIKGQKTAAELASEYDAHVSQINTSKKQALEALPEVFGRDEAREEAQREAERDRLYQQIGKLQVEVDWLTKDRTSRLTVAEKCRCIEPSHRRLSIARQCALLGLHGRAIAIAGAWAQARATIFQTGSSPPF